MATPLSVGPTPEIEYPDSDGQPMSDNTLQFQWITTLQGNLDILFRDDPAVFVAGDLLWYPVQGHPEIRAAPDALVAFGRPKGYRGSYRQWQEGGIAPQVVFEILSPGNRPDEMADKLRFYDTYGVEEYYLYDPDSGILTGWRRVGAALQAIPEMHNWVSPRLKIRFDLSGPELVIGLPNGQRFLTFLQLGALQEETHKRAEKEQLQREKAEQQAKQAREQAKKAEDQAEQERLQREKAEEQTRQAREQAKKALDQAEQERLQREKAEEQAKQAREQATQAEQQAKRLADQLRALGIDPKPLPE